MVATVRQMGPGSAWSGADRDGAALRSGNIVAAMNNPDVAYGETTLPAGIRSRFVDNHNGIRMHVLEAGFDGAAERPCVVLLHGFPELAYSWRRVMPRLVEAGFHVVAPDQRGYGRSDGTDVRYADDLSPFTLLNHVRDTLGLVLALGHRSVAAVVGHDYGSPVAAWCALVRPDVFRSVVLMSAPFEGAPDITAKQAASARSIHDDLAALDPPRKHYHWYYSTPPANADMWQCSQGVHDFLRAYYHFKSADWTANTPFPLTEWSASELAKLPRYYVMDLDKTMAEQVASEMPSAAQIAACDWLSEEELRVYSSEYGRTGFQGGLESYRVGTDPAYGAELRLFAGRTIDVPACFIGGASDWGVYQRPGRLEHMQRVACTRMRGIHLVDGAGHWVQQEQPEAVSGLLIQFLREL
jgi:pimeloyl-ACP methyl ester carboxylesterase